METPGLSLTNESLDPLHAPRDLAPHVRDLTLIGDAEAEMCRLTRIVGIAGHPAFIPTSG